MGSEYTHFLSLLNKLSQHNFSISVLSTEEQKRLDVYFSCRQFILYACEEYPTFDFLFDALDSPPQIVEYVKWCKENNFSIPADLMERLKERVVTDTDAKDWCHVMGTDPDFLDRLVLYRCIPQEDIDSDCSSGNGIFGWMYLFGDMSILFQRILSYPDPDLLAWTSAFFVKAIPHNFCYKNYVREVFREVLIDPLAVVRWLEFFPQDLPDFMDRIHLPEQVCVCAAKLQVPLPDLKERITSPLIAIEWARAFPHDADDMLDRMINHCAMWWSAFGTDLLILSERLLGERT